MALAGTAATGYHLLAYNPVAPLYTDQRNASLYTHGDSSVIGKYQNCIETITVDIVGTSRDDLFVKLRALFRAIENARDYVQFPNRRNPSYLIYQPDTVTNTAYSCILGGRVDVPGVDANIVAGAGGEGEQLANTMTGIIITIEREPFWRSGIPENTYAGATTAITTTQNNPWSSFSITAVPGDVEAPIFIEVDDTAGGLDTLWIGYASAKRKTSTFYGNSGAIEIEGGTMGTDTTAVVDATASPGSGSSKIQCTFATVATDAERVTQSIAPGYGTFRIFARCKLTAAGTVTMYIKLQNSLLTGATKISNATVTITHTAWRMIDMGIITIPTAKNTVIGPGVSNSNLILSALRSAGAGLLDVDFLFVLPVDEGVIQVKGGAVIATRSIVYGNMLPGQNDLYVMGNVSEPMSFPQWSGYIRFQPGLGKLVVIGGDSNFANTWAGSGGNYVWLVKYFAAYLTARGNG